MEWTNIYKNKKMVVLFHLFVWLVLFSLPYLLSAGESQALPNILVRSWMPMLAYMVIFYLNYLFLVQKYLLNKKVLLFILFNAVIIVVLWLIRHWIEDQFFSQYMRDTAPTDAARPPKQMFIYIQLISSVMPIIFAAGLRTTERWIKSEADAKEAQNIKLSSELELLRYQLQPHFFFNSLNNIYSLIDIAPEQAKATTHNLSKLMRYLLYETETPKVSLDKEIDFMLRYVELMKLRVADNVHVKIDFPKADIGIQIAPLLFISLVENAFKHGVAVNKECDINISMKLDDETVSFCCINHYFPKQENDKSGSGIGIVNLTKRLELLYPGKYSYTHRVIADKYIVQLEIPLA